MNSVNSTFEPALHSGQSFPSHVALSGHRNRSAKPDIASKGSEAFWR
jgi:hypothetical protein